MSGIALLGIMGDLDRQQAAGCLVAVVVLTVLGISRALWDGPTPLLGGFLIAVRLGLAPSLGGRVAGT